MDNQLSPSQDQFWILLSKKLAGEASPEELQQLHIILINNPDLHHHADMLTDMWQQGGKPDTTESEAAYMRHIMKHKDDFFIEEPSHENIDADPEPEEKVDFLQGVFSKRKLTVFSFTALFILVAGSFYLLTKKGNTGIASSEAISSVVTKNGNRTKIVLPDGSQVWLNAGSKLDYNNSTFNKELREVSLNGEAYFDVTKNANKPFIIHTKKMDIKVVGTAFNVRSYSNEKMAEAALIRGSIEVTLKDRKGQKIMLTPNEKISVANDEESLPESKPSKTIVAKKNIQPILQFVVAGLKPNPTIHIIGEIAWTQNKLYFEDESLEDIGPMIERWFGKQVVIQSESLKKAHYTGNFENETMEEVLSSLKLSKPFNFRIENDTVVIY